jgi:hypothetical protein
MILIPIPIKFKLKYVDGNLAMHIYNIDLISKIKSSKKKDKLKDKRIPSLQNFKFLLSSLNRNKFKPTLRLKLNLQYGLDDAAYTAIFYGLISALSPSIIKILNCFFKIKKQSISIIPNLNKLILKLELESIIFVNLVKVIYISYIIYKISVINKKNKS